MRDGRPDLYLGLFSRTHPTLAVLGFAEFASAAYTLFDEMAELIVADAVAPKGGALRTHLGTMKRQHRPDLRGGRRYVKSARHTNYLEMRTCRRQLGRVRRRVGGPMKRQALVTGAASGIGARFLRRNLE
ncbi:MAG: hypothetical protein KTR31_34865 [Myxococcales bacterium]|nr:hypothetical protein [Myxococcales bacterium]